MSPIASVLRRERSLTRRFCLAIVLAAGLNIVWGVGLAWAIMVISSVTQTDQPYVQILMEADGTPVRVRRFADGRAPENTTLGGQPYPVNEKTAWLQGANLSIESPQGHLSVTRPVAPRIEGFTDGRPAPVDWFFVQFRQTESFGYFVGYDRISQQRVGYLGRSGFQLAEPTVEQVFPISRIHDGSWGVSALIAPPGTSNGSTPQQSYVENAFDALSEASPDLPAAAPVRKFPPATLYLVSRDRTYRIDLRARTVKSVLEAPDWLTSRSSRACASPPRWPPRLAPPASDTALDQALAVRQEGSVIVLDASGRQETVFRLPAELADRPFNFFQMSDRSGFAMPSRDDGKTSGTDLLWFTKEGTITNRADKVLAAPSWRTSEQSTTLLVTFAIPTPLTPVGAALSIPLTVDDEWGPRTYREAVWSEIPAMTPALIVSAVLVAIALGLYVRRTARYGEQRRAAWIVLIALWGLPAYFGYVLARRRPAQLPCESCGEPAPRDRDACVHCGEEFAVPAPNGLEIFA